MTRARRLLLAVIVAVAVGVPALAVSTACEYEDSTGCVWWGPLQGNGHGAIIVNIP